MIVPLLDSVAGVAVYINPQFVVTMRPDPSDPDHVSVLKISDGENIHVRGDHREVAQKLRPRRAVETPREQWPTLPSTSPRHDETAGAP